MFLLQFLLPSQDAGFAGFGLGFRNHVLFLIQDRETGVGQNVVGIEDDDLLGGGDGVICPLEILVGTGKTVESVSKRGVGGEGSLEFGDGMLVVASGEEVEGAVVVVLGEFARSGQERIVMQRSQRLAVGY